MENLENKVVMTKEELTETQVGFVLLGAIAVCVGGWIGTKVSNLGVKQALKKLQKKREELKANPNATKMDWGFLAARTSLLIEEGNGDWRTRNELMNFYDSLSKDIEGM